MKIHEQVIRAYESRIKRLLERRGINISITKNPITEVITEISVWSNYKYCYLQAEYSKEDENITFSIKMVMNTILHLETAFDYQRELQQCIGVLQALEDIMGEE